jgi:hypothetical protein
MNITPILEEKELIDKNFNFQEGLNELMIEK